MPGTHWGAEYDKVIADLAAFRESLPSDDWRALLVGPVPSVVNAFEWVVFLPDGSKEYWDTSDEGDGYRERFAGIEGLVSVLTAEWPWPTSTGRWRYWSRSPRRCS
jgi:hypothetical protein